MTKMEAERILSKHIRGFSDERLHEVYAFNQDGKMSFSDPCACILGVTSANHPHVSRGQHIKCPEFPSGHYTRAKYMTSNGKQVEQAYIWIAGDDLSDIGRQKAMEKLLTKEIRIRTYERAVSAQLLEEDLHRGVKVEAVQC